MIVVQTRQRGAEFVELRGFAFARRRRRETRLRASHQLADHDCHDEEDDEDHHVRWAMDGEGVIRWDKKIVERQKRDQRAGDAGAKPPEGSDQPERD